MGRHSGQGRNGTGGSRPKARREVYEGRVSVGPIAAEVGLLRALLAKKLDPRERAMASSMLRRAESEPLTERQRAWLEREAKAYGAVYEGPDVPATPPPGCVGVESWGLLPSKPPRRPVDA